MNILVAELVFGSLPCGALRFGSVAASILNCGGDGGSRESAAVHVVLVADLDIAGTAAGTSAATVIEVTPMTDRAA
ncbi:hypothetical protein BraRD5C2_66940 [Bradyrhizobium sp. RD5-C2]|nr:hypothetical protein BraRD5C2_66940 [Bradyrhizobium sp. RD5-C2]